MSRRATHAAVVLGTYVSRRSAARLQPRGSMLTRLRDLCSLQVPAIRNILAPRARNATPRLHLRLASYTLTTANEIVS